MSYSDYEQFVDNLTAKQVRAFASQVGIKAWASAEIPVLRAILRASEVGARIWTDTQ